MTTTFNVNEHSLATATGYQTTLQTSRHY